MVYTYKNKPQRFLRRGRMVDVDSVLERRVIEWLDAHGYADHLHRPKGGLGFGSGTTSWTPDLQLAVNWGGHSVCAYVEIKPTPGEVVLADQRRIARVATKHKLGVVLYYIDRPRGWYNLDLRTAQLVPTPLPSPADDSSVLLPLNDRNYSWKHPLINWQRVGQKSLDLLEVALKAPFLHPSRQSKGRRRR